MVLRKMEPAEGVTNKLLTMATTNGNNSNLDNFGHASGSNEQPSIKRQRIDQVDSTSVQLSAPLDDSGNSSSSSSINDNQNQLIIVPQKRIDVSLTNYLLTFQNALAKQCLCGVSEKVLKKPFQYYQITNKVKNINKNYHNNSDLDSDDESNSASKSETSIRYIKSLKHWPDEYLLKFLANLQLLFNVYLKQNAKGSICGKIMEMCDCIIRNEINIFEDLIELCNSNDQNSNKFINYLASKVLTNFLIIIKDEIDQEWLKKIVDNLFTFEHLDYIAVKRINFSLDIIKCIVEWKDYDDHPLEDDSFVNLPPPPIEANYFATSHNRDYNSGGPSTSSLASYPTSALPSYLTLPTASGRSSSTSGHHSPVIPSAHDSHENLPYECQMVQLTDSESFDTTHIKCITIKILENKWPALVKNISSLITQISTTTTRQIRFNNSNTSSSQNLNNAENCILTFINLWESIISVRTNLSVIETLPFYAHLVNFELLLNQNLSCLIYKQMLQLFNEALCYGSTLALQDLLPEETCALAHQIVRHVKDYRILESMPRQINYSEQNDDNLNSLVGLGCQTVHYTGHSFEPIFPPPVDHTVQNHHSVSFDKTLLQKMTLLVLKSVAVSVKEIRSDSSDSSIDSTDYEAFQEMMMIERSIRDVLKKLETFIKVTLEFHPESHFSKILIHLFDDQDDYLIEAMVCTLDVTSGISFRNNAFPELVTMLNPVYTYLEFLKMISNSTDLLLDLLVSNETCFLLYLLRFLKYIRLNWSMFVQSCRDCGMGNNVLDDTMSVMIRLRLKISRLVAKSLYPYDIAPVLRLLESCENLYEGNELS